MTVSEAKQTQRKAGRAARKALGPEERKAANAALCAFLWQLAAVQNAQTILLYAAFGFEADLSAFAAERQQRRAKHWPIRCAARRIPLQPLCPARTAGRWDSTASAPPS